MKKLVHLSTINKYLEWFEDDWVQIEEFVEKHYLDGIELGLTKDYDITKIPEHLIKGVHLSFYPMWLEFWEGKMDVLKGILGNDEAIEKYYGTLDKATFIDNYKIQYERAKALKAEYMVFHVSHIRPEDSFTWEFEYSDEDVIDASIDLINAIFKEDEEGPKLVLENLWWPGLTYLEPRLVKKLLDNINYKNKGLVLDVSHLILTNPKIGTEKEARLYITQVVEALGDLAEKIEVVHLNKTLPKNYMRQNHLYKLEKYQRTKPLSQKTAILKEHVRQMDCHQPFDHEEASRIIEAINPNYCVYETNPSAKHELSYFVKRQNISLGVKY